MAGGGVVAQSSGRNYEGQITPFVIFTCIVAAMGGLLFGYDLGISGKCTRYCLIAWSFTIFFE